MVTTPRCRATAHRWTRPVLLPGSTRCRSSDRQRESDADRPDRCARPPTHHRRERLHAEQHDLRRLRRRDGHPGTAVPAQGNRVGYTLRTGSCNPPKPPATSTTPTATCYCKRPRRHHPLPTRAANHPQHQQRHHHRHPLLPPARRATAVRTGSTTNYGFTIPDHHGTTNLRLDYTAQTLTWRQFTPHGAPRGTTATWIDNRGFLNQPVNPTTGLNQVGARNYDPQQLNSYNRANNNPATFSDPTGLFTKIEGGAGGRAGGATGAGIIGMRAGTANVLRLSGTASVSKPLAWASRIIPIINPLSSATVLWAESAIQTQQVVKQNEARQRDADRRRIEQATGSGSSPAPSPYTVGGNRFDRYYDQTPEPQPVTPPSPPPCTGCGGHRQNRGRRCKWLDSERP